MAKNENEINDINHPGEKIHPNQHTILGATTKTKGEIRSEEDLIIQGEFKGKIYIKDHNLLIEKAAHVEASLQVKNITILGKVTGDIVAKGKIFIGEEAEMIGDISASSISIQNGAKFKGNVKMLPSS